MNQALSVLLHNDVTTALASKLRETFPDVTVSECNSYSDLPAAIATHRPDVIYTVRFAGTPGFPRDALFAQGGPSWISNGGVGTDHFGHWDPTSTVVTNAAGVAAEMMAEFILGGFLHFTLDVPGLQADKSDRVWRTRSVRPLKGKTLVIVGLGHTGQALAARAKAFGMQVLGTRARPRDMANVDEVGSAADLPELLPRADFIAVCAPLTTETRGLVGERELAAMKPGGILADVSRGGIVDQTALLRALETGHVAGAALDVFETEPLPEDNPIWRCENLIISPHCSSVYDGWQDASFDMFLANLRNWMRGEPLANVIDPLRGY